MSTRPFFCRLAPLEKNFSLLQNSAQFFRLFYFTTQKKFRQGDFQLLFHCPANSSCAGAAARAELGEIGNHLGGDSEINPQRCGAAAEPFYLKRCDLDQRIFLQRLEYDDFIQPSE